MSQKPKEPRCLARIVREEHAQYFANGKNKFYLEQRCPNTALPNKPTCSACAVKYVTKLQTARAYPHGLITEPLPDHSHLFGSEWYEKAAEKWGDPPARIVLYAIQFQEKARAQQSQESQESQDQEHKAPERRPFQMPRKKKDAQPVDPVEDEKESQEKKKAPRVPRPRKAPKALEKEQQESQEPQEPKKKRVPKPKKPEPKPIDQLIHPLPVVHQASVIPTHIEEEIDDVPIDGYEVEEVIVRRFVHQETTYFREYTKNKLYRCVKGGIGPYVGRWDPASDSVVTEVPDSDDERSDEEDE